jgi:hypothetical protein
MTDKEKLDAKAIRNIKIVTWIFSIIGGIAIMYIYGVFN